MPPEGLFEQNDGDRLEVRWRGAIAPPGGSYPGVHRLVHRFDEGSIPYYGFGANCRLENEAPDHQVVIDSAVPDASDPTHFRAMRFSTSAQLLAGSGGTIVPNIVTPYAVVAVLVDLELNPGTGQPERMCVTAVPDLTRSSSVHYCANEGWKPEVGTLLPLYASIALDLSNEGIEKYVAPLGLGRCACYDGEDQPVECPDG